jgi:trans-aconitate 2-methyltransferase
MVLDVWDPEQYELFRKERGQAFADLVSLVQPTERMRVVDLGCGTGERTRELHAKLSARETVGVDSSAAMLEKCRAHETPGLSFVRSDLADYDPPSRVDLLFSNAALHWLPDHRTLLPHVARLVAPGGQIAVQVPANDDQPSHTVAARVAGEEPFRTALRGFVMHPSVLRPERYASLLWESGFRDLHVRLQVYTHELGAPEDVVDWVKGTLLNAYRQRLEPALYEEFLARYAELLLREVQGGTPFLFTFKRILMWGRRRPASTEIPTDPP